MTHYIAIHATDSYDFQTRPFWHANWVPWTGCTEPMEQIQQLAIHRFLRLAGGIGDGWTLHLYSFSDGVAKNPKGEPAKIDYARFEITPVPPDHKDARLLIPLAH